MSQYPSWRRDYRRQKYLEEVQRVGRAAINAQKREYYRRNKAQISQRLRHRYATDAEYRENEKAKSRNFYKITPERELVRSERRKRAYWKDPSKFIKQSNDFYHKRRAAYLERLAAYRHRNRGRNRLIARSHALLITDLYCREQLSKYHDKSMWEWTPEEVEAKRTEIMDRRNRRITDAKAEEIRELHLLGHSVAEIASMFQQSVSNIYYILTRKTHATSLDRARPTLQMLAAAAQITNQP